MSQQQTVLRVQTNIPDTTISGATQYDFLDLYSDIPIKISKSFAELQDIATKNSDYSIGLSLPGSKKNNRFFENFFNVDTVSLFFNASKRVECQVLLNDQAYFRGYLRLNKVSVLNSLIEYDVTLYSTVGNLFGNIGNNLLKDLNFNDPDYFFNHVFNSLGVGTSFRTTNFSINGEKPYPYIYPVVHNGYEYSGTTVTFSGATSGSTRFYTSTNSSGGTLNSYSSQAAAWADGVEQFYINSPGQGLINNQLKPAINIWSLIKLIFKTYGYTIKSDFMNTPWIKSLYMYGYFSSEATKFGYKITNIQELPLEGVEIITYLDTSNSTLNTIVCKLGTGIPCFSLDDITYKLNYTSSSTSGVIVAGTSGNTTSTISGYVSTTSEDVAVASSSTLKYFPKPIGAAAIFEDGNFVDFGLVIDQNIKQIDVLSSITKKFNLVFIPDSDVPNQLIIEPFDFYMGTGNIYDWTPKLSYDKGWSVEPALNFIESTLLFTDKEDQDEGNREFKARNNRIYGQNNIYNPTDFKSQNKTIDTIFSPELIRKWDKDGVNNIGLPLGINYAASSSENVSGTTNSVTWSYKGVKTQPKLMYWLGAFNPFLDQTGEVYTNNAFSTYSVYLTNSSASAYSQYNTIPAISHTMPLGLEDNRKINNDSLSILFNSELPTNIGVQTFNVYTENDVYNKFYKNRITNLYNPNTRFLSGYFDLKYSDVQNLNGNDLIKINEQLFLINKLNDYNLTNRELTNVELVQYNTTFQTYTDRYFIYTYTDNDICYKFKTDFTNPNLLDTNYGWSVYYDYQLGSISGTTATGFTSNFLDIQDNFPRYIGYTITEVSKQEYDTTNCKDWVCDSLRNEIYSIANGPFDFNMPTFWTNSGATFTGVNLFNNPTDLQTTISTYGILTGDSTFYGEVITGICETCFVTGTGFGYVPPFGGPGFPIVNDMEIQRNNKVLVGGVFNRYNGTTIYDLVRLNTDGSIDTTFNYVPEPPPSGQSLRESFNDIKLQRDRKILVNYFRGFYSGLTNTSNTSNLRRLNVNGSYDTSFNNVFYGFMFGGREESVDIQSNNKIIVGGPFTNISSSGTTGTTTSTQRYIQRLNTNGTIDFTFNSGGTGFTAATGATIGVDKVLVLPDDKILVAGKFTQYNGVICNCLIKLNSDGSVDGTFTLDTSGIEGNVYGIFDVEIQSDGKILCGVRTDDPPHPFFNYLGNQCTGLFRLNSNGTFDSSFPYNVFSGGTVEEIKVLSNNSMYITNSSLTFIPYSGTPVQTLFRLFSNGYLDTSFDIGTGFNSSVYDVEVFSNNKVLVGGRFEIYNGTNIGDAIVKLLPNGAIDDCTPLPTTPTPTPTPTPTITSTPTPTPTGAPTFTPTPTPTVTPTPTPTSSVLFYFYYITEYACNAGVSCLVVRNLTAYSTVPKLSGWYNISGKPYRVSGQAPSGPGSINITNITTLYDDCVDICSLYG